jgi:hypothetical protein
MTINNTNTNPIIVSGNPLEVVEEFVYLSSKMTADGDCQQEVATRVSKANQAFAMVKPIWRSTGLSIHTKLKIFKSNILAILLYGSECWKTSVTIEMKLQEFQNKCLRRIFKIFWPNTISNEDLHHKTGMSNITETIQLRKWRWLEHVCGMSPYTLPRTPQRKRNRGRPKETWRRTVERELKKQRMGLRDGLKSGS